VNILVKLVLGTAAGCGMLLGELQAAEPVKVAADIDRAIDQRLAEAKLAASPAADDAEFCRRAYLDLTGRIPTIEQAVAFLDSRDANKRAKLIDELLASHHYGRHFAIIWSDLIVKRDENNIKLRPVKFKDWLADSFNKNRGWHEIVSDLLTSEGTADGSPPSLFILANRDMARVAPSKLVGTTANLFMGIQLQCAECHDHAFVKEWKRTDFWSLAAFFTKVRTEGGPVMVAVQDKVTVTEAPPKGNRKPSGPTIAIPSATDSRKTVGSARAKYFLGEEAKLDDNITYRKPFAAWLTAPNNPYFARAAVNRMWAHFFARGLVNPIEDMRDDNAPSHPELLQALAKEFAESGYDLKQLIRCITLSRTYQRTSQPMSNDDPTLFGHMAVKVMGAEVLYDSLCIAMGENRIDMGASRSRDKTITDRDLFVQFFSTASQDDAATDFSFGIPQFLRLMNAAQFNKGGAVVDRLAKENAPPEKVIEGLFLATLARRPTEGELKKVSAYVARKDSRTAYNSVLWILLNSAEFVCNR
jgi:hypothetical protein